MLKNYLAAAVQVWASDRVRHHWPGFWRLKKRALAWQLRGVQKAGVWIEIAGPLVIENRGSIEIGNRVILGSRWYNPITLSVTEESARLLIEDDVFINYGVEIGVRFAVTIGARAQIGNECLIYDTDWHSLDGSEEAAPTAPTSIGRGAWLGARVIVMKGVTIGDNTVVAANSVVTSSLPERVLAAGSPARVIRPIERSRYTADQ